MHHCMHALVKLVQNLDLRCVLMSDPSTLGAGGQNAPPHLGCWGQNASRIQNDEVHGTLHLQRSNAGADCHISLWAAAPGTTRHSCFSGRRRGRRNWWQADLWCQSNQNPSVCVTRTTSRGGASAPASAPDAKGEARALHRASNR